jgi:hypothetical protein
VVEYQDGSPGEHYQAIVTDPRIVAAIIAGWAYRVPGWSDAATWAHLDLLHTDRPVSGGPTILGPYDERQAGSFACTCGWRGSISQTHPRVVREQIVRSCPSCGIDLVREAPLTINQVLEAAARGVPDAAADLREIEARLASDREGEVGD